MAEITRYTKTGNGITLTINAQDVLLGGDDEDFFGSLPSLSERVYTLDVRYITDSLARKLLL